MGGSGALTVYIGVCLVQCESCRSNTLPALAQNARCPDGHIYGTNMGVKNGDLWQPFALMANSGVAPHPALDRWVGLICACFSFLPLDIRPECEECHLRQHAPNHDVSLATNSVAKPLWTGFLSMLVLSKGQYVPYGTRDVRCSNPLILPAGFIGGTRELEQLKALDLEGSFVASHSLEFQ